MFWVIWSMKVQYYTQLAVALLRVYAKAHSYVKDLFVMSPKALQSQ